jgi:serine/threonine protein kinase
VLYALLAGYLPFNGEDDNSVFQSILKGKLKFPSHFSAGCREILIRLLEKDPETRASLSEIREHAWFLVDYQGDGTKGNDDEKEDSLDAAVRARDVADPATSAVNISPVSGTSKIQGAPMNRASVRFTESLAKIGDEDDDGDDEGQTMEVLLPETPGGTSPVEMAFSEQSSIPTPSPAPRLLQPQAVPGLSLQDLAASSLAETEDDGPRSLRDKIRSTPIGAILKSILSSGGADSDEGRRGKEEVAADVQSSWFSGAGTTGVKGPGFGNLATLSSPMSEVGGESMDTMTAEGSGCGDGFVRRQGFAFEFSQDGEPVRWRQRKRCPCKPRSGVTINNY